MRSPPLSAYTDTPPTATVTPSMRTARRMFPAGRIGSLASGHLRRAAWRTTRWTAGRTTRRAARWTAGRTTWRTARWTAWRTARRRARWPSRRRSCQRRDLGRVRGPLVPVLQPIEREKRRAGQLRDQRQQQQADVGVVPRLGLVFTAEGAAARTDGGHDGPFPRRSVRTRSALSRRQSGCSPCRPAAAAPTSCSSAAPPPRWPSPR
jgi:hypothetical protein